MGGGQEEMACYIGANYSLKTVLLLCFSMFLFIHLTQGTQQIMWWGVMKTAKLA